MQPCPRCGGSAETDPEHARVVCCLSCWHTWVLPGERPCAGTRNLLAPGLRMLEEYRDLNR
ncbi:hypothetical protein GCM10010394_31550 [Streptomyces crystallinus]|uniref:Uncharacterized protein n=1 Tax=Streptomyces crystallinus TaxID=68191 RepID=A0ABP3R511_9ACTN